jgi:uncharacterized protein (DUF433 family)
MSTGLDAIQEMLPRLSPGEEAQLLQWVARDLGGTTPGIDKTPGVCGGEARVMRTRIPVWTLEQARRLGVSEASLLASYPTLAAEDLGNAWNYARLHAAEIERAIAENED